MIVIMKALHSGYNINISTIYKAQNAKEFCIFGNPAYFSLLFLYNVPISFRSPTSTMVAAGPVAGELVPDIVDQ